MDSGKSNFLNRAKEIASQDLQKVKVSGFKKPEISNEKNAVNVKSDGTTGGTHVYLENGSSLGLVQSINYFISVNEVPKLKMESIVTDIEFKILQKNTEIVFIPKIQGFWKRLRYVLTGGF